MKMNDEKEWGTEPPKTCDRGIFFFPKTRCNRPAYMEVYWMQGNIHVPLKRHWSYLCRYHYYIDRIKNFIFRWRNWYCDIDD